MWHFPPAHTSSVRIEPSFAHNRPKRTNKNFSSDKHIDGGATGSNLNNCASSAFGNAHSQLYVSSVGEQSCGPLHLFPQTVIVFELSAVPAEAGGLHYLSRTVALEGLDPALPPAMAQDRTAYHQHHMCPPSPVPDRRHLDWAVCLQFSDKYHDPMDHVSRNRLSHLYASPTHDSSRSAIP